MAPQPTGDGTSRAFTVIELLVVIALLAILMGVLIPVIGGLRSTISKRIECVSHLRALGQAALMYAADHRGNLVPFRMVAPVGDPEGLWYDHLYEYVGRSRGVAGRWVNGVQVEHRGFTCPAVPVTAENSYATISAFRRYTINRICGWKGHEQVSASEPQAYLKMGYGFVKTSVVELPGGVTKTAWFACPKPISNGAFLPENFATDNFIGFPHSNATNVLFMDGHVEKIPDPDFSRNPALLQQPQWVEFFGKAP